MQQLSPEEDTNTDIDATGIKIIQLIIGSLLYYAWNVYNKLLVAIHSIGSQQAAATDDTVIAIKHILDYVATYLNYGIIYSSSNRVLASHANTGFHNEYKRIIQLGAQFFYQRLNLNSWGNDLSSQLHKLSKFSWPQQ